MLSDDHCRERDDTEPAQPIGYGQTYAGGLETQVFRLFVIHYVPRAFLCALGVAHKKVHRQDKKTLQTENAAV